MKKQDLESGMIVKFREYDKLFILIGDAFYSHDGESFIRLNKYDEELLYTFNDDGLDIVEVYKSKYPNIMSCFIENKLELIWKREKEIDWSKVPLGTRVRVWDYEKQNNFEGKFINYDKEEENYSPFCVFVSNVEDIYWKNCELIEELKEEKEVTYEEVKKEFNAHCRENRCVNCKYNKENQCKFNYILDNYNITRK